MSDVLGEVEEVRLGLFRVCWKHSKRILRRSGTTSKQIELCGSQLGRAVTISFEVTPDLFRVMVLTQAEVVDTRSIAEKEPRQKRHKMCESPPKSEINKVWENMVQPKKVWFESAVRVSPIKVTELSNYNDSWEGCYLHPISEVEDCSIIVWIDFGTSEVRQTHMNKGLAEMLHSQAHCDVQFQFKDGQSVGAHIIILSASSHVFADMFQSIPKKSQTHVVDMEEIEVQVFKHLLDYLYTSKVPQITRNEQINIMLLYEAADKFGVEDLKKECVNLLLMQQDTENAIELLVWSKFHVIPKLFEGAMEMTVKNCKKLCT